MFSSLINKQFWLHSAERALKTFIQAFVTLLSASKFALLV